MIPTIHAPTLILVNAARRLVHAVDEWRRHNRTRREWSRLGKLEQAALMRDLGLDTEATGILYANSHAPRQQLPRMLRVFRVEGVFEARNAAVRRDLERVCALCPVKTHCARALASEPEPGSCGFCPNRWTLAALQH